MWGCFICPLQYSSQCCLLPLLPQALEDTPRLEHLPSLGVQTAGLHRKRDLPGSLAKLIVASIAEGNFQSECSPEAEGLRQCPGPTAVPVSIVRTTGTPARTLSPQLADSSLRGLQFFVPF
jgi:hypothetical protein